MICEKSWRVIEYNFTTINNGNRIRVMKDSRSSVAHCMFLKCWTISKKKGFSIYKNNLKALALYLPRLHDNKAF